MPKYLFLIHVEEGASPAPGEGDPTAWVEEAGSRRVLGNQTASWELARTVRSRGGKPFVTDGPFAETKDSIAGFDVVECGSLEEAVELASHHPVARFGGVEVRAFVE
jgi:hypothetical protein